MKISPAYYGAFTCIVRLTENWSPEESMVECMPCKGSDDMPA